MATTNTLIQIGVYDVTAKSDLYATSSTKQPFVDMTQFKKEVITIPRYATLEQDRFLLDGTYIPFPDDPQNKDMGFWSNLQSNGGGTFSTNPKVQFVFSKNHSSIGLTLDTSSNGDFNYIANIKWYDLSNTILKDGDYNCTTGLHVIDEKVDNYRRIDIEFKSTTVPYRWIKLDLVTFGIMLAYEGQNIILAKLLEEVDPISATLPVNELSFKLYSPEKDFSLANPKGIYTALQQTQPITVTATINTQKVQMGTYYLDNWKMESELISTFDAVDIVGILDRAAFKDGKVYVNQTAQSIIDEIKTNSGVQNIKLAAEYQNIQLSGWIPICTYREALQQVAFALSVAVESTRENEVYLYPISTETDYTITNDQRHIGGRAEQLALITNIEIVTHNYEVTTEAEEVYRTILAQGTYEIQFTEPTTQQTAINATITIAKTNYVIINVPSAALVIINAKKYKDNKILTIKQMEELPAGATRNTKRIESATLVNQQRAADIIDNIYNYYQNRRTDNFSFKLFDQQAGRTAKVQSIGGTNIVGVITKMDIDLTKGYIANTTVLGNNEDLGTALQDSYGDEILDSYGDVIYTK